MLAAIVDAVVAANVLPPGSPAGIIAAATVGTVTVVLSLVSSLLSMSRML